MNRTALVLSMVVLTSINQVILAQEYNTEVRILKRGEGEFFSGSEHSSVKEGAYIKLTKEDTRGAYSFLEGEWGAGWAATLHMHREHDETFVVLEGEFEVTVGNQSYVGSPGMVIFVPRNTPHAFSVAESARVIFMYSPGGYEDLAHEQLAMTDEERNDPQIMAAFRAKYDIYPLDSNEQYDDLNISGIVLGITEGRRVDIPGSGEIAYFKVLGKDTGGDFTLVDDYYLPGGKVGRHLHREHEETFYIAEGELQATIGDMEPFVAEAGTLIHVPRGTYHGFEAAVPVKVHMVYSPGGLLEEGAFTMQELSPDELKDPEIQRQRGKKYDIVPAPSSE